MMLGKLERVRAHLASIRMVQTEPATVEALTEAIAELDELLVAEVRAAQWVKDSPPPLESDEHTNELLALFAGSTTCGELIQ